MTFRGVRHHLLKTFSKIWIVNLHGDSGLKEKCPDGSADFNIFNIQQGVSIIIGVKLKDGDEDEDGLAAVKYVDLWGTRESKLRWLEGGTLSEAEFKEIRPLAPEFSMVNVENANRDVYMSGFALDEMMPLPKERSGVVTSKDRFALGFTTGELRDRLEKFASKDGDDAQAYLAKFLKTPKAAKPDLLKAIKEEVSDIDPDLFRDISYRPFDTRRTYYTGQNNKLIYRCSLDAMSPMKIPGNISIAVTKHFNLVSEYSHAFCHRGICDYTFLSSKTREGCRIFPLLAESDGIEADDGQHYNFDPALFARIAGIAKAVPRGERKGEATTPRDVFNYIYGVLHCPGYRSAFRQSLAQGFPRIPWPSSPSEFWSVSEKGESLIGLHLMESKIENPTFHPLRGKGGDDKISNVKFKDGNVEINSFGQSFADVPEEVWNFQIGSYRPARDWLKKRKGLEIDRDAAMHYEKILNILAETHRIMQTIEMDLPEE